MMPRHWWGDSSPEHQLAAQAWTSELRPEDMAGEPATEWLRSWIGEAAIVGKRTWGEYASDVFGILGVDCFSPGEFLGSMHLCRLLYPRLVALASVLNDARHEIGKPIVIVSGYRPIAHNMDVGGAARSDHTFGCAVDARCADHNALAHWCVEHYGGEHPYDTMSIGIGRGTVHIGLFSPVGHRRWMYDAYGKSVKWGDKDGVKL